MREYYSTNIVGFYTYHLGYHDKLSMQLQLRIKAFEAKHEMTGLRKQITYQLGLRNNLQLSNLYIYKENGVFREFFSGQVIGRERHIKISCHESRSISPDVFEGLIIETTEGDKVAMTRLTESQFASDVRQHMGSKDKLARIMSEYCDIQRAIRKEDLGKVRKEAAAKQARDNHDASWLNDFLNKRK